MITALEMLVEAPGYATHLPALVAAVTATDGPVLELGCGVFSTRWLHGVCGHQKRLLISVETNREWMAEYADLECEWHQFCWCEKHQDNSPTRFPEVQAVPFWSVVFVDLGCYGMRATALHDFADRARYLVVHDTEVASCAAFTKAIEKFPYRLDCKADGPLTSVLSRIAPIGVDIEKEKQ